MSTTYVRWTMPLLTRAAELRNAGLSYADVGRVLELDHGVKASGASVSWVLQRHMGHQPGPTKCQPPLTPRRKAA